MESQKEAPITTLYQLASELAHMRQRQAKEMAEFLRRINPAVFASQDREEIMQPMMLGMLEKQQQTHQLLTLLNVACPVTNKEGDDILLGLYRPWLEDVDERVEAKAKEVKKTIQTASQDLTTETPKGRGRGPWTVREIAILHALYPILGHDHEAYESVLPNRSATSIASKIEKEYLKGHLPKHDARAQYKRPQSIDSEITRATTDYWASIKDTITQPTSSELVDSAEFTAVRSTPMPTIKKTSRPVGRPKKSDSSGGENKVSRAVPDHAGKRTAGDEEGNDSEITPSQKRTRRPRATKDRAIDAIKDTIESMRKPFSDLGSTPSSPPSAVTSEAQYSIDS
ncbi:hypothetical protein K450DRAFT_252059 [Umbelopsis ramanniana AG]|uniref:Uncharacterized protein n=1 Tax=Umbelopsis ramanniana AG TaxID=1314678 RepID=A0AAD5HCG0_UMBRA|nr:uncharacterized protein K450DRAFT_252059 [Umbelopsis ramanniana AG]KAI8577516.1 hypothetical protein K450DRAFT_252059 [Umbelopsis ramanniana AG]